ncbi:MAG: hypothetical protein IMZ66_03145 [Planctomycetes bacterium]|nr:hypothetical protein [Planctomycetota bacterium]
MTQNSLPPASGIPPAAAPARQRTILGKIALALALVPWAYLGLVLLLQPG